MMVSPMWEACSLTKTPLGLPMPPCPSQAAWLSPLGQGQLQITPGSGDGWVSDLLLEVSVALT